MNNIIQILNVFKQKIPSWKTDIGRNLLLLNHNIPRKTDISGHFHLKTRINANFLFIKSLIF
jgi:hypothetical protein